MNMLSCENVNNFMTVGALKLHCGIHKSAVSCIIIYMSYSIYPVNCLQFYNWLHIKGIIIFVH